MSKECDERQAPCLSRRRVLQSLGSGLLLAGCRPWSAEGPLGYYAPHLRTMLDSAWPSLGLAAEGVRIAVIDTGFGGFDKLASTSGLRIQVTRDIVDPGVTNLSESKDVHGTRMLEGIGGRNDPWIHGLAHRATFLLARAEDPDAEPASDEVHAAQALRWAVSQGVDVLNISLGYSTFDDGTPYRQDHLDGATSLVSRTLAGLLRSHPKLVAVVSAGNEGDRPWGLVTFPGDVAAAITVGTVRLDLKTPRRTSGRGPMSTASIKPDLVVPIVRGGASLATAAVAGLVACLRQAAPSASRDELATALRVSGSFSDQPDRARGFGVPNARRALEALTLMGHSLR